MSEEKEVCREICVIHWRWGKRGMEAEEGGLLQS